MKLYIAGPMSGIPNYNFEAFHLAAEIVRGRGHVVVCPAESFGGEKTLPMGDYARYDTHALLQMDGLVLLAGWERSPGACTEVALAHWLGLFFFEIGWHEFTGETMLVPISPKNPVLAHVELSGGPITRKNPFREIRVSDPL